MNVKRILFLDIETVSNFAEFSDLDERLQSLWIKKSTQRYQKIVGDELSPSPDETYKKRAAIFAEFGKVACISVGAISGKRKNKLRIKSFYGKDESKILSEFSALLNTYFNNPKKYYLCGHNIKEFDVPYICRRMLLNNIALPNILQLMGKKPWQTQQLLDTLYMWKFGDYKHYTSLELLTTLFNIDSPKNDISGAEVGHTYWEENNLKRIAMYCEQDVIATTQLFLRMNSMKQIEKGNIIQIGVKDEEE